MIVGLLRLLIIALLIYLIVKVLVRLILPLLTGNTARSSGQYGSGRKEGDVTIDYAPKKKKKIGKDEGDYIDYEDVK
jgi:hypothetical protein